MEEFHTLKAAPLGGLSTGPEDVEMKKEGGANAFGTKASIRDRKLRTKDAQSSWKVIGNPEPNLMVSRLGVAPANSSVRYRRNIDSHN